MKNVLISIIMPVYNADKYLQKTIESVLNQSFTAFEFIAINDGSTDNSSVILKKYARIDKRIIFIEQENSGVSQTRNKGLLLAKGKYITFLDSDDLLSRNFLEALFNISEKYNADIAITGYSIFYKNPDKIEKKYSNNFYSYNKNLTFIYKDKLFNYLIDFGIGISVWNKLFKTSFLRRYNIFFQQNQTYDEDLFFSWKCVLLAKSVYFDNCCRYYYRLSNAGVTMQYHHDIYSQYIEAFSDIKLFATKYKLNILNINQEINQLFFGKLSVLILVTSRAPLSLQEKKEKIIEYIKNPNIQKGLLFNISQHKKSCITKLVYKKQINLLLICGYLMNYKMKLARILKKHIIFL